MLSHSPICFPELKSPMRLDSFIPLILILSIPKNDCSGLSETSSRVIEHETLKKNPKIGSHSQHFGVSNTRHLRESGAVTTDEIEKAAIAHLKKIGATLVEPQAEHDFQRKHLEKAMKELFQHREVNRWIENVNELKVKNPEGSISVIPTMTTHLGDKGLYKILDDASHIQQFKSLAKSLQVEQENHWLEIKKDPEEVFRIFGLDKEGVDFFKSSQFLNWVKYVEAFNKKYPEEQKSMASTIQKHQPVAAFIKQIDQGKWLKNDEIGNLANTLLDDLVTHLIGTKTFSEALEMLPIHSLSDNFLRDICATFLVNYMEKNPGAASTLLSSLFTKFDDKFVAITIRATKSKAETASVAEKLESALRKHWLKTKQSAFDVYKLLKISTTDNSVVRTQLLEMWVSYMDYRIMKRPEITEMLLWSLWSRFHETFATQILAAGMKYPNMREAIPTYFFEKKEIPPDNMFVVLGLAEDKTKVFTNPWFPKWLEYEEEYRKVNPTPNSKSALVNIFESHFGLGVFEDQIKNLVKFGLENGIHPNTLKRAFDVVDPAEDTIMSSHKKFLAGWWETYKMAYQGRYPGHE